MPGQASRHAEEHGAGEGGEQRAERRRLRDIAELALGRHARHEVVQAGREAEQQGAGQRARQQPHEAVAGEVLVAQRAHQVHRHEQLHAVLDRARRGEVLGLVEHCGGPTGLPSVPAPDRKVFDARLAQARRVEEIAAVEDHRLLERRADALEVGAAELLPLGDDDQRVGAFERRPSASRRTTAAGSSPKMRRASAIATGSWATTSAPRGSSSAIDDAARRLAHVVGVRA